MRKRELAALALLVAVAGCPSSIPAPCTPAETRCTPDGNARETCGADGAWRRSMDCAEVSRLSGRPFECRAVSTSSDRGVSCLPAMGDGFDP